MQQQLEEAVTVSEAEFSKRRAVEAELDQLRGRPHTPGREDLAKRHADDAVLIKSLQETIKQREADVREARKIKAHAK